MLNKLTIIFTMICMFTIVLLTGCSNVGIYASNGEVTTPGLPPIFASGTNWYLPWNSDSNVKGTTIHISPAGEVTIKKNGQIVPHIIENNEIILDGILKGYRIVSGSVETMGSVFIKLSDPKIDDRALGQFSRQE